jgi:hypothetical protein
MAVLADAATQPPSIAEWLADLGLHSAVVVPVRVEGLGVEITPLQQSQTALHEAFHVHVQAPRWIANGGEWPAWDLQPDRAGVAACYRGDANVEFALADEQAALDRLVSALLDGAREAACNAGTDFLEHRALRYERAAEIVVARHDGEPGTCSDAEAILEAEEGTADFASWAVLHTIGEVTRDQLFGRYRAAQQAPYYVTGAMQLHGVYLMDPGGWLDVARRIARSTTIDDGSISTALASTLSSYCANDP